MICYIWSTRRDSCLCKPLPLSDIHMAWPICMRWRWVEDKDVLVGTHNDSDWAFADPKHLYGLNTS